MGKVFKKTLMGFSKEQVIAYIDALVDKQKAALEEEKEKYNQLLEENEKLTKERDEALEMARAEVEDELNALKAEKDGLNALIEEQKSENASLLDENTKLVSEKNKLSENMEAIKTQLSEYINNESRLKTQAEDLENENKALNEQAVRLESAKAELEKLRLKNAQLEAQLKIKNIIPAPRAKSQAIQQAGEKTEAVWETLKGKINELAEEFSELADKVKQEETRECASKTISIRDILEKVKRIGEKI